MITDQEFNNDSKINWTILKYHTKKNYKNNIERIKKQRFIKTHPHLFFKNYDLSVYADATYDIIGNLDEFLLRILSPNKSIYLLEHPGRNSINNELGAVVRLQKETKKLVERIKKNYNKEKFPDNNGLAETCLIVRKHNDINCVHFMEQWFLEVKKNSHRDQLSFNYIWWKNKYNNVKYISKYFTIKYFIQHGRHLLNCRFK